MMSEESDKKDFFYKDGTLEHVMFSDVSPEEALTSQEKKQIAMSIEKLDSIYEEWKLSSKAYEAKLRDPTVYIGMRRGSDGVTYQATKEDIKNVLIELRRKALENVEFLEFKVCELLKRNAFVMAEDICRTALSYSKNILGHDHLASLTLEVDNGLAKILGGAPKVGAEIIIELSRKLKEKLKKSLENKEIKKRMAVCYYYLAQFFLNKDDFDTANKYLNRSESLRKEYNAPKLDMDRIQFLRGKIAYSKDDMGLALQQLTACYEFRKCSKQINFELIPVLDLLIAIHAKKENIFNQAVLLTELLNIKKKIPNNERDIIMTQLRLLNVMKMKISANEYWNIVEDINCRLKNFVLKGEDAEIGILYLTLSEALLCPPMISTWANIDKRSHYSKVYRIIGKAKSHLKASNERIPMEQAHEKLIFLEKECSRLIECFHSPDVTQIPGIPLHPKDEAALLNADLNQATHENSTKKNLMYLSEFSSEVRHSLVDETERVLTVEEFVLLPQEGQINPCKLRTAQGGINAEFRDGRTLDDMKDNLVATPNYTNQIPPVEIGIYNGKVYSFDTRRLIVHSMAKELNPDVVVRYKKISGEYLKERIDAIFSSRPWNGTVTALRRRGKNSESTPYINPAYRSQLENKVEKGFECYPSRRQDQRDKGLEVDSNGFHITKKKAEKVFDFLKEKPDSRFAKRILKETSEINKNKGKEAALSFLVTTKSELKNRKTGLKCTHAFDKNKSDEKENNKDQESCHFLNDTLLDYYSSGENFFQTSNSFFRKSNSVSYAERNNTNLYRDLVSGREYIRHKVSADGDCGLSAFGITREDASRLLIENILIVREILSVAVSGELLLREDFYLYLEDKKLISGNLIDETLSKYANDPAIIQEFINFDVRDKNIENGWIHMAALQALAKIQRLKLYIWKTNDENRLIPHEEPYGFYEPKDAHQEVHLLFVNNDHFERLEVSENKESLLESKPSF